VVSFQETTPVDLLEALSPAVLIKGANYKPKEIVGANLTQGYGEKVFIAEVTDIYATNSRIARTTKGTF